MYEDFARIVAIALDGENIYQWSKALERVEMTTVDFEELIIPKNSLVYCDPPYINSNVSYGSVFSLEDQKRCFRWSRKISQEGNYVLLSNKTDGVFFEKMVQGDREFIKYLDYYHSSNRGLKKATELLVIFSYPGR
jgi:site-specific DNA-adenine methylase